MTQSPVTLYGDFSYGKNHPWGTANYGIYPNLSIIGIPPGWVWSVEVAAWTQLILYSQPNYAGSQLSLHGPVSIPNLASYRIPFGGMTQSLKVVRTEPSAAVKMACCNGTKPSYECGEYKPGTAQCTTAINNYCSTNMQDKQCQAWCRSNSALCDNYVQAWCDLHPTDPYCACIKSPAQVKGLINPKCIDRNCLNTGYLTTTMQNTNCPSMVNCDVQVSLANSGISLANTVPIQQNCGANNATTGVNTQTPNNTPTQTTPTGTQTTPTGTQTTITQPDTLIQPNMTQILLIVLIFILIICVVVIAIIYIPDFDTNKI